MSLKKKALKRHFLGFIRKYLSHWFTLPLGRHHEEVLEYFLDPKSRRIVIAVPRGHGKTTFTQALVIWSIATRRHRFIVYLSASRNQATLLASNIKVFFEGNPAFTHDYGFIGGDPWRHDVMGFVNGVTLVVRGITEGTRGLLIEGRRPDLIILDDVETDKHHLSAVESEKLVTLFLHNILNLGDQKTKIIVIGTMGHPNGLINTLANSQMWKAVKYRAIEDGKPLWPERWPLEALEEKRLEIGEAAFAREFLNEPVHVGNLFKEFTFVDSVPSNIRLITMGIDFATGRGSDWNAAVITAHLYDRYYVVLHAFREKSPTVFKDRVIAAYRDYKVQVVNAEANNFQTLLIAALAKYGVRIIPLRNTENKIMRIGRLDSLVNNGVVMFLRTPYIRDLIAELEAFPNAQNDDLADAFEMSLRPVQSDFYISVA